MVLYEVNIAVDSDIAGRYAHWLETHVQEMLSLPGFEHADVYHRHPEDEGAPAQGRKLWTLHYRVSDRQALVHYLTHEAPRMRKQAIERFGEDKFAITRRILEPTSLVSL